MHSARNVGLVLKIAVLMAVLVGCGGTPPPGTPATGSTAPGGATHTQPDGAASAPPAAGGGSSIAACDLLTDDQITQVAGAGSVESMQAGPVLGIYENGCEWTLDDGSSLTVGVIAPGGRQYFETYFEPFVGDDLMGLDELVSGIGDKAIRQDIGGIIVLEGDIMFDVQAVGLGADDEASARALAEAIAARLP